MIVFADALLCLTGAGIEAIMLNAVVGGGGQVFGHEIHHAGNANASERGDGAHGNNAPILHALPEAQQNLVVIQLTLVQVFHH